MKKNKQKIFSGDWLEYHPYQNSVSSDLYYLKVSNEVYNAIDQTTENLSDTDFLFLSEAEKKQLSCLLTCYFEDIISQTNIWNTFTRTMQEQYGKWLPFYTTDEYAEEEINEADIRFLCWHYLTQLNEGQIAISPEEPIFKEIAQAVYPIFDREFESAPENTKMQEFLQIGDEANLFEVQNKFFWLGTESYLFSFNSRDLEKELNDVVEVAKEHQMEDHMAEMINMVMTDFSFNNVTEFFQMTAAQWLAKILGEDHVLYEPLMSMTAKKSGYFIFQEQDSMYAQFKHVATGDILHVTNRSLAGYPKDLKSQEVVVYAGFVEWQGEWWFIGDLRGYDAEPELIAEISSREEEVNLFNEPEEENPTVEEQKQEAQQTITELQEENPEEEQLDIHWSLLYNENLTSDFLKEAVFENQYPELKFPGENGADLMKEDFAFVLSYFRRR
ncbi:MAG: DUF3843 family protein [Bacteroidales bacterium]